jgi:hypothetical protein
MKHCILFSLLLSFLTIQAQPAAQEALDNTNAPLNDRYGVMKSNSQTYGDYKVIKEYILDGFWKIATDSIRATKATLKTAKATISRLESKVDSLQKTMLQKESSMEEMVFASTHISVAGINVNKAAFKGVAGLTIVGLLLALGIMTGKLNILYTAVKEKMEVINLTSHEFEDFKKKAMERQTKLSRELQTERNKLMEMKRG